MEEKEHRRKSKRYPVRWKAAVVFDKSDGKPILHTQTEDLSVGGAAIRSNYGDVTGSVITLLLAHTESRSGEAPKILKIRARVVSSVQSPATPGFRHGLSFVQSAEDGLDILAGLLSAAEPAGPGGQTAAASAPAPAAPSAPAGSSRLEKLKQLAQAKQAEQQKPDPQPEIDARVSQAVEKAYRYLKEFTDQLNIVKPAYAKEYAIVGIPNFDGLIWDEGKIDLNTREGTPTTKLFDRFTLQFRLSANKQLRVTRDSPAYEKLNQVLLENKITFSAHEERNERGIVVRASFVLPCEVNATLLLAGNFKTGKLLLRTRNVERFGLLEHVVAPEAITDESLDELTGFILGESARIGPLLLINA